MFRLKYCAVAFALSFFTIQASSFAYSRYNHNIKFERKSKDVGDASRSSFSIRSSKPKQDTSHVVLREDKAIFLPVDGALTGQYGTWRGGKRKKGRRASGHVHTGVDIAAPYGTPIYSTLSGTVGFVGQKGAYGLTVIVDHGDGFSTLYGHTSKVFVSEGDSIKRGQLIANIGMTGRTTGPHVHYEVRKDDAPVNPVAWTTKLQTSKNF